MLSRPDRQIIDDAALEFLRLILPDRGPYVAMIVESKQQKYNKFAPTIEALWEIIKTADSAGHTAYHACASFKEAKHDRRGTPPAHRQFGRTHRNAFGAKSFWLDVDAGSGKPYADWKEAAGAVAAFCQSTGLPPPLCIMSGRGWHVYWPLEQTLDPETWERYASGLQTLCIKHGLKVDSTRTTDISSVLRTPGTHHRKEETRQVQLGRWARPFPIETLRVLVAESCEHPRKRSSGALIDLSAKLPAYLASAPRRNILQNATSGLQCDYEPSSGAIIAERCEQVRALRDTGGRIPEPQWYAALGVLAFCEDGEELGHHWSSGDPRYTEGETHERLERARQLSGATTCNRFHDLDPTICLRCPFKGKINSPVVLGRKDYKSVSVFTEWPSSSSALVNARVRSIVARLLASRDGHRGLLLHWCACCLGDLIRDGKVPEYVGAAILHTAGVRIGIDEREIAAAINQVFTQPQGGRYDRRNEPQS